MIDKILKNKVLLYGGIAVLALIFFGTAIRKILKSPARQQRQEDRKEKKQVEKVMSASDAFDVNFWQSFGKDDTQKILADKYAKTLRKAMRGLGTKESSIMGVFSNIKSKSGVSLVSWAYYNRYKRSLVTDLVKELTKKENVVLMRMVDKMSNS